LRLHANNVSLKVLTHVYHFLGFIWNCEDTEAASAAQRFVDNSKHGNRAWNLAIRENGLAVLEAPPEDRSLRSHSLPNRSGVVLGRVFPTALEEWRSGWSWLVTESGADSIVKSQGRTMIEQIWGGYVAFLYDKEKRSCYVIRDCSGKIPCYRLHDSGVDIVFSDLADLRYLGLPPFTINFEYVTAFACSSQLQIRASGLNEVTELLAGDCFAVQSETRSQHSLWHPMRIYDSVPVDNFDVAVSQVRFTTQRCVDAWESVYRGILHNLSGGLDSAVVLGCLRNAERSAALTCVNRYGIGTLEDERRYARLAASDAGVRLVEYPFFYESRLIDKTLLDFPQTMKPTVPGAFGNLDMEFRNNIARQFGANSSWTGQGGDHLFMQTLSPIGAQDYLALKPVDFGLLQAVRDAARVSRQPYWMVLRSLASKKKGLRKGQLNTLGSVKAAFLTQDAQASITAGYLSHPWTVDSGHFAPGRQLQIAALSEVLNRHRPFPGLETVYEHHPLLSQPLIELCLRIPSYLHLRGGITRAVERSAFQDCVPLEILAREQKGQSTSSLLEVLRRSEAFVRELVLDGILAREKIIDRRTIEPYLRYQRPMEIDKIFPLLSCIAAELWLQSWETSAHKIAA
jgi:asparagine synthase (glutamine-hydrolysing)